MCHVPCTSAPVQAAQERTDAVKFIFESMDMDGDGFLKVSEMHRFAELCGFDDEWQVEYEAPCLATCKTSHQPGSWLAVLSGMFGLWVPSRVDPMVPQYV